MSKIIIDYCVVVKKVCLGNKELDYLTIPGIKLSELLFEEGDEVKVTIERVGDN